MKSAKALLNGQTRRVGHEQHIRNNVLFIHFDVLQLSKEAASTAAIDRVIVALSYLRNCRWRTRR